MNTIASDPQIYIQSLFDAENPETPTPTPVPPLRDHTVSETLDVLQTHTKSFTFLRMLTTTSCRLMPAKHAAPNTHRKRQSLNSET